MHARDAGRSNDGSARLLVLPHEVNGELSSVDQAFVVHVCALGRGRGRDGSAVAVRQDEDGGLVNYACVSTESIDAALQGQ